jgi:hypothetical protein
MLPDFFSLGFTSGKSLVLDAISLSLPRKPKEYVFFVLQELDRKSNNHELLIGDAKLVRRRASLGVGMGWGT